MKSLMRGETRSVTHVAGLIVCLASQPRICFLESVAARNSGASNHTVPAGAIKRRGSRRFEHVDDAMLRELSEEIGCPEDGVERLSGLGAPVAHITGKGVEKRTQGYFGIVRQPYVEPRMGDEIAAVHWTGEDGWADVIATMHVGKQRLVCGMMMLTLHLVSAPSQVKQPFQRFLEREYPAILRC